LKNGKADKERKCLIHEERGSRQRAGELMKSGKADEELENP